MLLRNKALQGALVVALLGASVPALAQKVGFVDIQRAINEVDEGAKAKKKLKDEFDAKQRQLDQRQNELKAMKEDLDSRSMMMKPEVKQEKVAELQKKLVEVQQLYFQLQTELTQREQQATAGIITKMGNILQTMGREAGFDVIVEKSAVLYAKNSLDLTNELIRRYNGSYGKKKKK